MARGGDPARGLPIAFHLGLLVALAFASAFVVMLAVVILLPPRPPDVARGDHLVEQFAAGFSETSAQGRAPSGDGVRWRIQQSAPAIEPEPALDVMHRQMATRLGIEPAAVRVAAETARSDVFVFRVREVERRAHEVEGVDGDVMRHSGTLVFTSPRGRDVEVVHPDPFELELGQWSTHPPQPAPPAPTPRIATTPEIPAVPPAPRAPMFAPAPPGVLVLSGYELAARLPDGRWLTMRQGRDWEGLSWIARAALVIGATLTMLSLLALLFARRLARPIQSFAHAVEAVGVDPLSEPVAERGPQELRGAARAVNTMQARLRALIADRTKTLAAVAHDMRTPLMRLRLTAENVEPTQRERMAKEIGEVEALVASFIAFARDDPAEEARVRLDLAALLQSLADDHAEAGRAVSYESEERFIITGQSLGLKRLFGNLIDNALKYGAAARVSLRREVGAAIVEVADDGPGVPAAQRESVFEPFVRLNEAASGAGLGLPAARSIARAHGGDIAFLDSEKGARVRVSLPA